MAAGSGRRRGCDRRNRVARPAASRAPLVPARSAQLLERARRDRRPDRRARGPRRSRTARWSSAILAAARYAASDLGEAERSGRRGRAVRRHHGYDHGHRMRRLPSSAPEAGRPPFVPAGGPARALLLHSIPSICRAVDLQGAPLGEPADVGEESGTVVAVLTGDEGAGRGRAGEAGSGPGSRADTFSPDCGNCGRRSEGEQHGIASDCMPALRARRIPRSRDARAEFAQRATNCARARRARRRSVPGRIASHALSCASNSAISSRSWKSRKSRSRSVSQTWAFASTRASETPHSVQGM